MIMKMNFIHAFTVLLCAWPGFAAEGKWKPAEGPLTTRWTADVSPRNPLPEYPRPQMVRKQWQNLNGLWQFAVAPKDAPKPSAFEGSILVPFPIESALSGVKRMVSENERIWYRRLIDLPLSWRGKRILLHFGAVDFEAKVWINGLEVGTHRGGYDAFSFDITDALRSGLNELVVSAWDPTDAGTQPRGKQVRKPHGIWYTPVSGIWQTVWLEPVNAASITGLKITPDVDGGAILVEPITPALLGDYRLEIVVKDRGSKVASAVIQPGKEARILIPKPKLWSPEKPFLYDLTVNLNLGRRHMDTVQSYFGMRKISLGKDHKGFTRIMLNNEPYFQFGPLDQGFWPDGIYTAPTDQALRYDIEMTRKLGFNMARKHVKVEPARWYYWCDKLGLLVWQDMPSGDKYISGQQPDITRTPESGRQFEQELTSLVAGLYNHPSIVTWVPYNEGWGQWDTARISEMVKKLDPSRLVNSVSGWTDRGVGDMNDMHKYPGPGAPEPERNRATVLGEFGGLGLPMPGHTWQAEKNWGYRSFTDRTSLQAAYLDLIAKLFPLIEEKGLSAAVYTQTTDVEIEVNGLMTYDRAVVKMDPKTIADANKGNVKP
jgi:beta-galactosidase/beta-glucuronidase